MSVGDRQQRILATHYGVHRWRLVAIELGVVRYICVVLACVGCQEAIAHGGGGRCVLCFQP